MANGAGPKPRPLPPSLTTAAAFGAGQGRDRQAERAATPPEGPVLLELPTRSYTQPEETEEMHERARQQQMMRTMEAFTHPEGVEEAPQEEAPEEAPEAERVRPPAPGPEEAAQFAAQQQQARQVQAQELAVQGQQSVQQKIRTAEQYLKQLWRVVGGVQGIASIKIVPLITLVLQSNLQTINHIFHVRFIPEAGLPEDVRTGCLNGILCCLLVAAFTPGNLWETFTSAFNYLLKGLF